MSVNAMPSIEDMIRFLPETVLIACGTLMMVIDALVVKRASKLFGNLAILSLLAGIGASVYSAYYPGAAFSNLMIVDAFGTFFRVLVMSIGIMAILQSYRFLDRENAETGEYHALILFSVVGQCVMVTANELIMIFIGLEISSIATYVLAGYLRDDKRANEAALKYFLLGSFATAFLLYGVAIIYGITGSTNLATIRSALTGMTGAPSPVMAGVAAALIFVGLAFKVSAAPFQIWAPDVYQGAPTPVTAFMATGPKAAAFAIFLRIFISAFQSISNAWEPVIWISALLSMCIGNFAALTQSNVKRLLAYSSIAHAGYVLVALAARSDGGTAAVMFYMAAYALMNVGAFAVVSHLSGKGERYLRVDDFAGLGQKQPLTAAMLSIFLLSLIGVPLTAGFFGKFYIFKAALQANLVWLTVLGLLNSAVAAYYYLRILVLMYMHEPGDATERLEPLTPGMQAAIILPAVGTFVLGIFPSALLNFAGVAATLTK